MLTNQAIITDIRDIILNAKHSAIRVVDYQRTLMYWHIGKRIFEEEQSGKDRADYGSFLIKFIAEQLEPEYGSGFSKRQVELFRQFYRIYPIANTLYSQLGICGKPGAKVLPASSKSQFQIQVTIVQQ